MPPEPHFFQLYRTEQQRAKQCNMPPHGGIQRHRAEQLLEQRRVSEQPLQQHDGNNGDDYRARTGETVQPGRGRQQETAIEQVKDFARHQRVHRRRARRVNKTTPRQRPQEKNHRPQ